MSSGRLLRSSSVRGLDRLSGLVFGLVGLVGLTGSLGLLPRRRVLRGLLGLFELLRVLLVSVLVLSVLIGLYPYQFPFGSFGTVVRVGISWFISSRVLSVKQGYSVEQSTVFPCDVVSGSGME